MIGKKTQPDYRNSIKESLVICSAFVSLLLSAKT